MNFLVVADFYCVVIMPHYDVVREELIEKTESEIVY